MSQASRSAVVDIDVDEIEMRDIGHAQSLRNRRATVQSIKRRHRKSTQNYQNALRRRNSDMGRTNFNRMYLKVKKLNQEVGVRRLWNALIKVVEDKLGADATVYFSMVAWLIWMLIPSIVLVLSFLFIPQIYYRFTSQTPSGYAINNNVTWHDFFTGEGWLEKTELFEGYFTNTTIGNASYEMPIAYFVVIIICYLSFLLLLAKSYAQAISERYVEHDRRQIVASNIHRKIFCYWNFTICNKATADVCRANITEDMKKFLNNRDKQERTSKQLVINIISHIVIFLLIVGIGISIFFAATKLKYSDAFLRQFAVSIMTSVASVIVPPILSLAHYWETYQSRTVHLFVPLFRNFLLQIILFFTFVFLLFTRAVCFQSALPNETFPLCAALEEEADADKLQCWETWFGQQIYRWQIVDLISVFVLSLIFLCLRRLFVPCRLWRAPIVNVEQMVMHLLLTQCFVWFGLFASPLMPLILLIKLVLSFLWFRLLVSKCCRPSNKPWKSQYAMNFFRVAMAFGFILSIGSMVAAIAILRPSPTCGPFRHFQHMIDVVKRITQGNPNKDARTISLIISFFNSFGFNVFFTLCWLVLLLLMRRTAQAKEENLRMLRNTIKSLAKDKVYYTKKIKSYEDENPYRVRPTINRPKEFIKRTPSGTSIRSEDAPVATLEPLGSTASRQRSVAFEKSEVDGSAFQAENLAFSPDSAASSCTAEQSTNLDAFPSESPQPSLTGGYPDYGVSSPASHEASEPAADDDAAPPINFTWDQRPQDTTQLINNERAEVLNGIDSPFFAGLDNAESRDLPNSNAPDVPAPDY